MHEARAGIEVLNEARLELEVTAAPLTLRERGR
jgi:hypothetical protein